MTDTMRGAVAGVPESRGARCAPESRGAHCALISGGSRGLGRVLTQRLLEQGWRVATFSRNRNEFVSQTMADSHGFVWRALDLDDHAGVSRFARDVYREFGRLDLLVNNAAILQQGLLLTMPPSQVEAVLTSNLLSAVMLVQAAVRAMAGGPGGAIINISSVNAIRGYRGTSVYGAAKAGLEALTRSLARELGPMRIRVNCVSPGFFASQLTAEVGDAHRERILRHTPLGRLATVDDIADAVLFLASEKASFITGQTLVVDGGITC